MGFDKHRCKKILNAIDKTTTDNRRVCGKTEGYTAYGMDKSNGELKRQFITTGAVQLSGERLTDPAAPVEVHGGDVLRLSKKHSVQFI